jgi:hypothetical protein
MFLPFKLFQMLLDRLQPHIDPRGIITDDTQPEVLKDKMQHNVLHPGGATFVGGRDDDIVGPFF